MEFFGVYEEDLPTLRAVIPTNIIKFKYEKKIQYATAKTITEFIDDIQSGKTKPFLKSAPEPESNDGPIIDVVGSTFEKIVHDPTKDVFVYFYVPWCEHCQKFDSVWAELAEAHKDSKNLVIAKFDASRNDVAD